MSTNAQEKSNDPLIIAQEKYIKACRQLGLDSPSKQQTKDVLQELLDCEQDFNVKLAFTVIWQMAKDYDAQG